jgi:hypothetical protein
VGEDFGESVGRFEVVGFVKVCRMLPVLVCWCVGVLEMIPTNVYMEIMRSRTIYTTLARSNLFASRFVLNAESR